MIEVLAAGFVQFGNHISVAFIKEEIEAAEQQSGRVLPRFMYEEFLPHLKWNWNEWDKCNCFNMISQFQTSFPNKGFGESGFKIRAVSLQVCAVFRESDPPFRVNCWHWQKPPEPVNNV